jgi:polyvinyl alcohol dehydrogenase (cytochrome)
VKQPSAARRLSLVVTMALALAGAVAAPAPAPSAAPPMRAAAVAQDWPTYLHDNARSSASGDTIINTGNVGTLKSKWNYQTGDWVAASPAVVNNTVYVGSWDGNEYAIDGTTGQVKWQTALGLTHDPVCPPPNLGITSSATVSNGVVYVGGGDSFWYALSAANGAVLWKIFTGDNTQAGAHYNWASPLIVGNFAYIGIASNCDAPLVQGQLLKVDLTTHQQVAAASMVPNGQVGGGVWTSPTLDSATNTIFVTTGTLNLYSQTLSQAVVSMDAGTLAIKDSWQLPFEAAVSDSDWGTTPTLTVDSSGRQLVSAMNKNGIVYTLLRSNLKAGPVWQRQIAIGGDCPPCGDGSIASGSFANGVLYVAGGSNVGPDGVGHRGSVTAVDPGTGRVLWYHGTNEQIIGSIAYSNGLIFDPQGTVVEALDAATGNSLWTYKINGATYAAPAIANGTVYIGGLAAGRQLSGGVHLPGHRWVERLPAELRVHQWQRDDHGDGDGHRTVRHRRSAASDHEAGERRYADLHHRPVDDGRLVRQQRLSQDGHHDPAEQRSRLTLLRGLCLVPAAPRERAAATPDHGVSHAVEWSHRGTHADISAAVSARHHGPASWRHVPNDLHRGRQDLDIAERHRQDHRDAHDGHGGHDAGLGVVGHAQPDVELHPPRRRTADAHHVRTADARRRLPATVDLRGHRCRLTAR